METGPKCKKKSNLFISDLNKKDVNHFTSNMGLFLRRKCDAPYKLVAHKLCNVNVINSSKETNLSDKEYFLSLSESKISLSNYNLKKGKHNIILERYPKLTKGEPYIFVCNHTCPEDIETVLNVLDRNAYLVLGSVKTLKEEEDGYLVWLNGTLPFDISNVEERSTVIPKAIRVLKTNSILIFPEASHNLHPNKLINNLFDGPVNMALNSGRKIVLVSLIRDDEKNISYVDVSNPMDIGKLNEEMDEQFAYNSENLPIDEYNKKKIKAMTARIRDKMATSVMHILLRHEEPLVRKDYRNIEAYLRTMKIYDSFKKLHWNESDDFEGEFKTKKTLAEQIDEETINTLATLAKTKDIGFDQSSWVELAKDRKNKDIPQVMQEYAKKLAKIK